jgi:predicted cupin superfamily sugar epimerase
MPLSPSTHSADDVIRLLQLEPIPEEGGYFKRTGESAAVSTPRSARRAWSSILALFTPAQFSALHRLASDELWCFHAGDPLTLTTLRAGEIGHVRLGWGAGCELQHAIPGGTWQGAWVADGGGWSLVSCVVVPGFQWDDFKLGQRAALENEFPSAREIVRRLTR